MQKQNLLPPFSFLHLSLGAVKRVWGDQNISYLVITATPVLGEEDHRSRGLGDKPVA